MGTRDTAVPTDHEVMGPTRRGEFQGTTKKAVGGLAVVAALLQRELHLCTSCPGERAIAHRIDETMDIFEAAERDL